MTLIVFQGSWLHLYWDDPRSGSLSWYEGHPGSAGTDIPGESAKLLCPNNTCGIVILNSSIRGVENSLGYASSESELLLSGMIINLQWDTVIVYVKTSHFYIVKGRDSAGPDHYSLLKSYCTVNMLLSAKVLINLDKDRKMMYPLSSFKFSSVTWLSSSVFAAETAEKVGTGELSLWPLYCL